MVLAHGNRKPHGAEAFDGILHENQALVKSTADPIALTDDLRFDLSWQMPGVQNRLFGES